METEVEGLIDKRSEGIRGGGAEGKGERIRRRG